MGSLKVLLQFRPFLPWICSSLALGYVAYLHWKIKRIKEAGKKQPINKDQETFGARHEVNIDSIDRDNPKKRVSYCRCWKSTTFPLCDGIHKCHNKDHEDKVGPLVLVWNEPKPEDKIPLDTSIIEPDMDIKSIGSESPILQSSNGDSNGEFEKSMVKIDDTTASSDEQLSSLEMIEEGFDAQSDEKGANEENDDEFDENTVKVDH